MMLSNINKTVPNQHLGERQSLMTRLLDAVKQCQIRFGGRTELATDADSRVCCLSSAWECVLQHGLKHTNKALSTFKQVTEMTGLTKIRSGLGLLDDIKNLETEPAFWHCIKGFLNQHELERFGSLQNINTEEGRGRAWLRATLNEHSLEKYMHMLVENTQHLSIFYEDWAFLRDHERSSMLPNMAGGLGSILFAINIDNGDLNSIKPATGLDNLVSMASSVSSSSSVPSPHIPSIHDPDPQPVIGGDSFERGEKRKEKRKRRKAAKIVSFDHDEGSYSASPASSVTSPLSKTNSLDLGYTVTVSSSHEKPPTRFVFPSQDSIEELDRSSDAAGGGMKPEPSILAIESRELNSSSVDMDGSHKNQEIESQQTTVSTSAPTHTQKFPSASDVLNMSGVRRWQDVLGMDRVESENIEEEKRVAEAQSVAVTVEVEPNEITEDNGRSELALDSRVKIIDQNSGDDCAKGSKTEITTDANAKIDCSEATSSIQGNSTTAVSVNLLENQNIAEKTGAGKDSDKDSVASFSITTTTEAPVLPHSYSSPVLSLNRDKKSDISPPPSLKCSSSGQDVLLSKSKQGSAAISASVDDLFMSRTRRTLPSGNSVDNADTHSNLSFGSMSSTGGDTFSGTMSTDVSLQPVSAEGRLQFTDVTADSSGSHTESFDSSDVGLYSEATESAMQAVALAQKGFLTSLRTQGDGSNAPVPSITTHDTMTTGELKQAVIAMMMRKDEVEEQSKYLRVMLEEETERTVVLKAELQEMKDTHRGRQDADTEKIREITRENDLLKHQLRKYVNAVQMLRRQGASDEEFQGLHLDQVQPSIPPASPAVNYNHEANEYEKKLVQVAEMHGELIELNEHLQRSLQVKDGVIKRMRVELEDLRGPLPSDLHIEGDTVSIHSETSEINNRSLINVWIPSAFLRGTSSETYHVYQVYIRIRDEEWNVYRRYTEFRDTHHKLKKIVPVVSSLDFPPKKTIGHKEARFVEERRKKLQVYLRKMLNLLAKTTPDLCTGGCKQRLIAMLPFFGDQPVADKKNKKKEKRERSRSRGRSNGPPPAQPQVYNGL